MTTVNCEYKLCEYNSDGKCSNESIDLKENSCSEGYDFFECVSWKAHTIIERETFTKEELEKIGELKDEIL